MMHKTLIFPCLAPLFVFDSVSRTSSRPSLSPLLSSVNCNSKWKLYKRRKTKQNYPTLNSKMTYIYVIQLIPVFAKYSFILFKVHNIKQEQKSRIFVEKGWRKETRRAVVLKCPSCAFVTSFCGAFTIPGHHVIVLASLLFPFPSVW